MNQTEAFAALAVADPEAFKAVVDLAVDYGILRDAMLSEDLSPAGRLALESASKHADTAAQSLAALTAVEGDVKLALAALQARMASNQAELATLTAKVETAPEAPA